MLASKNCSPTRQRYQFAFDIGKQKEDINRDYFSTNGPKIYLIFCRWNTFWFADI